MKTKPNLSGEYPSLKLAYEQVRDVLSEQKTIGRQYAGQARTLLMLATAITGIGIPFILRQEIVSLEIWGFPVVYLTIIPIFLYFIILIYAKQAYKPMPLRTMNEPNKMGEEFWKLSPNEFGYEMLMHIRDGFKKNEDNLNKRAEALKPLLLLTISQALITVILAFGFNIIA